MFNIITGINELETFETNVNLMKENVIQINGGITINIDVSIKTITYVKNIIVGILVHVFMKMDNI